MTREEISVLSSARREAVRKQLEEIERYKSNPFLYILNPRVKVSYWKFYRQNFKIAGNSTTLTLSIFHRTFQKYFVKLIAVHQTLLQNSQKLEWSSRKVLKFWKRQCRSHPNNRLHNINFVNYRNGYLGRSWCCSFCSSISPWLLCFLNFWHDLLPKDDMDKDVSKSSNGFIFHYIKTVINVEQTAFNSIQTYRKVELSCFFWLFFFC